MVTQGAINSHTQSGSTLILSHPPVFRLYNHYIHLGFTQQNPTSPWLTSSVLAVPKSSNPPDLVWQLMVCMGCFVAGGSGVCPGRSSHHKHRIDNVQSSPEPLMAKLIGGLYIRCEGPACQQYVQLQNLAYHLTSGCRQHLQLLPDPTVGQLLSQSPHTPTTAIERRVATSLVKRMLAESPEENIVELVTGGHVQVRIV